MEKWIIELKEYAETNVIAMLIGYIIDLLIRNKSDLKSHR